MPTVQSNSVPITRLRRRKDFVSITRRGQKWATPGLVLQSHRRKDAETTSRNGIRVGFTVTKKVGNAVIRNRARRRLKSAALDVMAKHGQDLTDYVLIWELRLKNTVGKRYRKVIGMLMHSLELD